MPPYYYCKDCGLVIAGNEALKLRHAGHKHMTLNSREQLVEFGLAREAEPANISSVFGVDEDILTKIYKMPARVGVSGKYITTIRKGSYVTVRYFMDTMSHQDAELSEQEYFKLLFKDGTPPLEMLHTLSAAQDGSYSFVSTLIEKYNGPGLIFVTLHPDRAGHPDELLLRLDSWTRVNDVFRPFASMAGRHAGKACNVPDDAMNYFRMIDGKADETYIDLLHPRLGHHLRLLVTVEYSAENVKVFKMQGGGTQQVLVYEMTEAENEHLFYNSTVTCVEDWATHILEDARAILCS